MIDFSVIISTYNRYKSLKDTLDSLLAQESNGDFDYEILVVDNNSKDKTKELVQSYVQKFNGRLRYLFEPRQGQSLALNLAIKKVKGEIIAFTDDDVILDKAWLLNLLQCFQKYACDGVGGRVLPLYGKNTPKWFKDNKNLLGGPIVYHDYGEATKLNDSLIMEPFVGANMAFRRKCFNEFGLFNTKLGPGTGSLGGDTEFFNRLTNAKKLYYCGEALVWHPVDKERANLKYIARWCIAEGRYLATVEYKKVSNKAIYYWRIPRYLIRDVAEDFIFLLTYLLFNKRKFLKQWKTLFYTVGRIVEYKNSLGV